MTFVTAVGETPVAVAGPPVTTFVSSSGGVAETAPPNSTSQFITTGATSGGAMAPGNYYYRIEYVTSLGTTGWGAANNYVAANLTAGGTAVNIIGLPIGPAGVTGRRLYRTVANSLMYTTAAAFRLVATLANTGTPRVDPPQPLVAGHPPQLRAVPAQLAAEDLDEPGGRLLDARSGRQ